MNDDYRTADELKYFGSDLNKWINKNCTKDMTVINIDVAQYKRGISIIRLIESKHENETMSDSQRELLEKLARLHDTLEVFTVRGNVPYLTVRITNMKTKEQKTVDAFQLKDFLEFKTIFDNL